MQKAIAALPESNADKAGLEEQANAINNDVPNADVEPAKEARELLAKAKEAENALNEAIEKAKEGGLYDDEVATLKRQAEAVGKLKEDAQKAIAALPESNADKAGLEEQANAINNDVPNADVDPAKEARELLAKAKEAENALNEAIEKAKEGGLNEDEVATLKKQAEAADKLKEDAQKAIAALPESNADKASLAKQANTINNDVSPADVDPAEEEAKDLLYKAKAAEKALDEAIAIAQKDRILSYEVDELKEQAEAADKLKKRGSRSNLTITE